MKLRNGCIGGFVDCSGMGILLVDVHRFEWPVPAARLPLAYPNLESSMMHSGRLRLSLSVITTKINIVEKNPTCEK
jgi:hypothetical protein